MVFQVVRGGAQGGRRSALPVGEDGGPGTRGETDLPNHEPTARIIGELRRARDELQGAIPGGSPLNATIRALRRTERRLARPLRVAITGEFNSGKSSLANLLARIESLPTAVVSNTRIPTLLYHARDPEIWAVRANGKREWLRTDRGMPSWPIFRLEVGLPSPRLQALQILDLPGLADPRFSGPVDLTFHDVDAVIWCTTCTQAWKESERIAWDQLSARLRSRGLLVSTHSDLLRDPADMDKLLARLRCEAGPLFKDIMPLSTVDALALIREGLPEPGGPEWQATGANWLEMALSDLLLQVREQRAEAALKMTSRIAERALSRMEKQPEPAKSGHAPPAASHVDARLASL